ncbi:MAG: glycerophosphodiester phosphodiesterase family protein [Dysgonamonadaceae bacterium]|jgi:glycerophosphoryl diester phosphodiesterase|nr:glycerophosphodiester phosphodiesterase family protein [Dysgonamonadaceae bacterium]
MKRKIFLMFALFLPLLLTAQSAKVLVASHRGDWRNYADNSLEGIEGAIRMGVDIVEIDLALTKDSVLVLMHDRKVDRTTNGQGRVGEFTLDSIRQLRLKNGLGRVTDFQIPTLEEVLWLAKDRVILNLDKSDAYFDKVYQLLEKTGTKSQVIIKSDKPYKQLREEYGENLDKMTFMPVITLKKETTLDSIAGLLNAGYPYYEICFEEENRELMLQIKQILHTNHSVIWINSLWDSLCGGYSDDRALKDPDKTWAYLIDELGAGILQTDRPAYLIEYLKKNK